MRRVVVVWSAVVLSLGLAPDVAADDGRAALGLGDPAHDGARPPAPTGVDVGPGGRGAPGFDRFPGDDGVFGIGDVLQSAFFSPKEPTAGGSSGASPPRCCSRSPPTTA